ncbi:MAG: hypothetical protein IJ242_09615 [Clostridia bacterium]|nr:hypothetical protein [Clostridia bacterium]
MERIKKAVIDLYGAYDVLANGIKAFIERAVKEGSYAEIYKWVRQAEAENKENLLEYQEEKTGVFQVTMCTISLLRSEKGKNNNKLITSALLKRIWFQLTAFKFIENRIDMRLTVC